MQRPCEIASRHSVNFTGQAGRWGDWETGRLREFKKKGTRTAGIPSGEQGTENAEKQAIFDLIFVFWFIFVIRYLSAVIC